MSLDNQKFDDSKDLEERESENQEYKSSAEEWIFSPEFEQMMHKRTPEEFQKVRREARFVSYIHSDMNLRENDHALYLIRNETY